MKQLLRAAVLTGVLLGLGLAPAHAIITETDIYSIQQNIHAIGDSVIVDSVVVIGVDVRPTTYGVYIQEPAGGPFSGVLAYRSGNFPAYANSPDDVVVGDLITVQGVVADFGGLTEINSPILTKEGTVTPLAPEVLPPDSLANGYPGAERWEGVLVRVDTVVVSSVNTFNNWYFRTASGLDSLSGYEKMIDNQVTPQPGDTLASVTGVGDFAFGERRIAPRNNDDIVFLSGGPAPVPDLGYSSSENQIKVRFSISLDPTTATDPLNYSLSTFDPITAASYDDPSKTVTLTVGNNLTPSTTPVTLSMSGILNAAGSRVMEGIQTVSFIGGIATIPFIQNPISATNDTSQVNGQQVSFRGVVTAVGDGTDFPAGLGFYVQDRSATAHAGMFVFGSPVTPARNDSIFVSGVVQEFGVGPETEITSVDEVTILASGVTPVAPIAVDLTQISGSNLAEAEKYESALVKVSGVTVVTQGTFGQPFDVWQTVGLQTDTMRVDDLAIDEGNYVPYIGDVLDVTGVIRFSGTAPFRRLQPRNWNEPPVGDLHVVSKTPTSDTPPSVLQTRLAQNKPNPFNPRTTIAYTVGRAGHAALRVYDLRGRLVRTLLDAEVEAGAARVVWDGRDDQGQQVGSGLYFYKLVTLDGTKTRKMVLLK